PAVGDVGLTLRLLEREPLSQRRAPLGRGHGCAQLVAIHHRHQVRPDIHDTLPLRRVIQSTYQINFTATTFVCHKLRKGAATTLGSTSGLGEPTAESGCGAVSSS